jgi:hypothetical protein
MTASAQLPGKKKPAAMIKPLVSLEVKAAAYATPMQENFDKAAQVFADHIKKNPDDYKKDQLTDAIFKRYHVKKYILKHPTTPNKEVEAWVYDDESKLTPIFEDQAIKRCESLIIAAKRLMKDTDVRKYSVALDKLHTGFIANILAKPQTAESAVGFAEGLVKAIVELSPAHDKKKFRKQLFAEVEKPPYADYYKRDIFVLNLNSRVNSVQYYQRGTKPIKRKKMGDAKEADFDYRSAHLRDDEGISNFAACGKGFIGDDGTPHIVDVSFRHSSLPPIDLYKRKGNSSVETTSITSFNMEHLADEARSRLVKDEKDKQPLYLNIVSLLTVTSLADEQERQFTESMLAADRIRFRDGASFFPVTHTFGVNRMARKGLLHQCYPSEQEFENQRALFHTLNMYLEDMNAVSQEGNLNELKACFDLINTFAKDTQNIRKQFQEQVEEPLRLYAEAYDMAMLCYEFANGKRKPTQEDKEKAEKLPSFWTSKIAASKNGEEKSVAEAAQKSASLYYNIVNGIELSAEEQTEIAGLTKKLQDKLIAKKSSLHATANGFVETYKEAHFKEMLTSFRAQLKEQAKLHKVRIKEDLKSKSPIDATKRDKMMKVLFAMEDMCNYQDHYLQNTWSEDKHVFKIQAHIHSLINCLGTLRPQIPKACTVHCKSGADRTYTADVRNDGLRLERHDGFVKGELRLSENFGEDVNVNVASHCAGHASAQIAVIDTGGGGAKPDKVGHPYRPFRDGQKATSVMAGHLLAKTPVDSALTFANVAMLRNRVEIAPGDVKEISSAFNVLFEYGGTLVTSIKAEIAKESKLMGSSKQAFEEFFQFLMTIKTQLTENHIDRALFLWGINRINQQLDALAIRAEVAKTTMKFPPPDFAKIKTELNAIYPLLLKAAVVNPGQKELTDKIQEFKKQFPDIETEIKKVEDNKKSWDQKFELSAKDAFQSTDKGKAGLFKQALTAIKIAVTPDSKETNKLRAAYDEYHNTPAQDPAGKLQQLEKVRLEIEKWLELHKTDQAAKDESPKQKDKPAADQKDIPKKVKKHSRLPAMLALYKHVLKEMTDNYALIPTYVVQAPSRSISLTRREGT